MREYVRLIRFHEYGPIFLIAVLVGAIAAGGPDFGVIPALIFVSLVSASAFVVNDVTDMALDRRGNKLRNPVASGEVSPRAASILSVLLFLSSLPALIQLPLYEVVLGSLYTFLGYTYSLWLRAKERPPLDLIYHSLGPALLILMGYLLYNGPDLVMVILALMASLGGGLSEILQQLRDIGSGEFSSVSSLGAGRAISLSLAILVAITACYLTLVAVGFLPILLAYLSPLVILLARPILAARKRRIDPDLLIKVIHVRGLVIIAVVLSAYLLVCR